MLGEEVQVLPRHSGDIAFDRASECVGMQVRILLDVTDWRFGIAVRCRPFVAPH